MPESSLHFIDWPCYFFRFFLLPSLSFLSFLTFARIIALCGCWTNLSCRTFILMYCQCKREWNCVDGNVWRFRCIYRTNFNGCHLRWRHHIKGCVWLANEVDWLLIQTTTKRKVLERVTIFEVIWVLFMFVSDSTFLWKTRKNMSFRRYAVWVFNYCDSLNK